MPQGYHNGQPEDSYRADWERAVNGLRSASANGTNQGGAYGGYTQPQYQQPYQPQYQQLYQPQQVYGAPVQNYAPVQAYPPASVPQPKLKRRRGKRHVSGWYTFFSWVALFCWAGFIFYMSAHTSSELAQGVFAHVREVIEQLVWKYYGYVEDPVSPIGHFFEYFIFGALLGNALHCHMPLIPATIIAIACASGYGVTDEIHQLYVDGRYFDMEDWKVDTIAAAAGSVLASFFFYLFGSRREDYYEYVYE